MERRDRGRFIRGLVAVGDFCCINLVFLMVYLFFDSDMTHQFNQKIVWLLLNISYFPVVLMFNQIHNTRIIYIDSLLLAASESVVLLFLIFISLLTFFANRGRDNCPAYIFCGFLYILESLVVIGK